MKTTLAIIDAAVKEHPRVALAFSGGADSMVLMDIVFRHTPHRPLVVFSDSGMEYPQTLPFVEMVCARYGADLRVAWPARTPEEQWRRSGWPMLGKLAARLWMQKHRGRQFDIRLDVSSCCRTMKIAPARRLVKTLGCTLQLTGQRGGVDDSLRGMRAFKDGAFHYVEADHLTICNPLLGWTDMMIRRYTQRHDLPRHPARRLAPLHRRGRNGRDHPGDQIRPADPDRPPGRHGPGRPRCPGPGAPLGVRFLNEKPPAVIRQGMTTQRRRDMDDTAYFKDLTPRQQLNDLMHKYAQANGLPYGKSWREFERRFQERHRVRISYMKWSYCQDHQVKLTLPAFLETAQRLDQALEIAHTMTDNMMRSPGN